MVRPRIRLSITQQLNPYCKTIKKCHYKCDVALQVASTTTQEGARVACKECGAYGMLDDIGRAYHARITPHTRGRPW